jgi:hypothetical protein
MRHYPITDDVDCDHDDRTHLGLDKQTPAKRQPVPLQRTHPTAVVARPRLGGLHHRYDLAA